MTARVAPSPTPLRASVIVNDRAIDGASLCDALDGGTPAQLVCPTHALLDQWTGDARARGIQALRLVGGEPLLREDLFEIIAGIRQAGLGVELVTSGRLLLYPKLRQELTGAGLAALHVPLHGPSAAAHDALVRVPGAWDQVTRALGRLRHADDRPPLHLRVALRAATTAGLSGLPALARRLGARQIDLCHEPESGRSDDRDAAPWRRALGSFEGEARAHGVEWSVYGLPACLFHQGGPSWGPGQREGALRASLAAPAVDLRHEPGGGRFHRHRPPARSHLASCLYCAHTDVCPGIPAFMEAPTPPDQAATGSRGESLGDSLPEPLPGPLPNSFHLERIARGGHDEEHCPRSAFQRDERATGAAPGRLDVDRQLFWIEGPGWQLLEAQTDYFTRRNLAESKARGMLYVNVSGHSRIDQFQEQLRQLKPAAGCAGCERACPGGFSLAAELAFQREEESLRGALCALRGDVLDVGFGPGFYQDLFASLQAQGLISYHGLDPDAEAVEAARRGTIDGSFHLATLEGWERQEGVTPGPFDHVLLLRSWNHLFSLAEAAQVLTRLLRPGGRLLIVENLRFGYHVPPEVPSEEGGRYEHHRNHDLPQAEALLSALGFEPTRREPIAEGSGNQWLLELRWPG